jgi:Domain of unknown function (DUF3943)
VTRALARVGLAKRACTGLLACSMLVAGRAWAQTPVAPSASASLFSYSTPAEPQRLRAAAEELALLALGLTHYFYNKSANSVDWDLKYDWASLEGKLTGKSYSFDTNHFETNFLSHPASGTLYYLAARGNRLGVLESFVYAFVASAVWEFLGEYRERVSVNDLIVTPLAGLAVGETTTGFGAWFLRSCDVPTHRVVGALLTPMKSLHDLIDGAEPRRPQSCGAGAGPGAHHLSVSLEQAVKFPRNASSQQPTAEWSGSALAQTSLFDDRGKPRLEYFSDGNISRLALELALSKQGLSHLELATQVVPSGVHIVRDEGTGVRHEATIGLLVGMNYELHRYEPVTQPIDHFFVLEFPALSVAYRGSSSVGQVGAELVAGATFGGADAFALRRYASAHALSTLTSVAEAEGYNHAVGFVLAPSLTFTRGAVSIEADGRADRLVGLRALDRNHAQPSHVSISETRRSVRVGVSVRTYDWLRLRVGLGLRERTGRLGNVSRAQGEVTLLTGLEARLP